MLKTFRDFTSHLWILGMEAFETIASYSVDAAATIRLELERAGERLITERVRISYEIFFDSMPREHLEFLTVWRSITGRRMWSAFTAGFLAIDPCICRIPKPSFGDPTTFRMDITAGKRWYTDIGIIQSLMKKGGPGPA